MADEKELDEQERERVSKMSNQGVSTRQDLSMQASKISFALPDNSSDRDSLYITKEAGPL